MREERGRERERKKARGKAGAVNLTQTEQTINSYLIRMMEVHPERNQQVIQCFKAGQPIMDSLCF